jgi:DNA-directed RNA polymerase specialized sigma24 family protein
MTKDQSLADNIVNGVRSGNAEAFDKLLSLTREIAAQESRNKHMSHETIEDIIQQALVDVLTSIEEKRCNKDSEIPQIITRSIVDQTEAQLHLQRLEKSGTNLDYGEVNSDYLDEWFLRGKTSVERTPPI